MADRTSRIAVLIMGVIALFALAVTPSGGSTLGHPTRDELVRAGFTCDVYDIDAGIVVCTKDNVRYVCDKSGSGCTEAPSPVSNLKKDDLEKDGYSCKFGNISGGMVICTKGGSVTYYCDKFGDHCAPAPFGDKGLAAPRAGTRIA